MEYIIKIKSKFNYMITINSNFKRKIEENSFQTFKLSLSNSESITIFVEPISKSNNLLLPYNIYIKNLNNKLEIESNSISSLNYKNVYIITLEKLEVVKDMKVIMSSTNFSVFNTYTTNITIQNKTVTLPKLFSNISQQQKGNYTILTLDDAYLFIFNNNNEILFNDFYNKIKLENNFIEILTNLNDLAKHSIITTISNNNVTKKTVYQYSHPKLTSSTYLIPFAFLQALKVDNINLAKHYLTQHLKDIATLDSLKSFFGDYKKYDIDGNNIVLFYPDKTYKIFSFDFSLNKISKINTL